MDSIGPASAAPAGNQKLLDERGKARLQRAVRDFESLLLGTMLKSMRSGIPKSDMFGDSYGGDVLEGMFDAELASHISRNSSLGLGEMLYKEITGEELPRHAAKVHEAGAPAQRRVPAVNLKTPPEPAGASSVTDPPDTVRQRVETLNPIVHEAAERHGVDANLLKAVIAAESAGRTDARSAKDAKGVMQLIDSTASAMGVRNVWDARENVQGGAKYLSRLIDHFGGDLERAVASYNAGPGAVEKHGGIPPYPETRSYVQKVMNYFRYFEQQEPGVDDKD